MSNGKTEEMLTQLIKMVGTVHSELQEVKGEVQGIKVELEEVKAEQKSMREEIREIKERQIQFEAKNEERYEDIMRAIHSIKADQDYIFVKTVRNEREIEKLKNH